MITRLKHLEPKAFMTCSPSDCALLVRIRLELLLVLIDAFVGGLPVLYSFLGNSERLHTGGHANVCSDLQETLLDFGFGDAVSQGSADVSAQFRVAVQGGKHAYVEYASITSSQSWPCPDTTPCILCRQVLHRHAERRARS